MMCRAILRMQPPGLAALLVVTLISTPARAEELELRFGVAKFSDYNPLADIDRLAAWGFDYAEPALSQTMTLSEEDFAAALRKAASTRIHVEAMNWFVPPEVKLTGPAVDRGKVEDYVVRSLSRAEALGAKIVVFGSGGARSVPDGFPREKAWTQLQDFLRTCGEEIRRKKYGMVIGIEPLRKAESNIVNTAAEALRLARDTAHPKVRIIVDFYHLAVENEDPGIILEAGDQIVHLHIANPGQGRVFPKDETEEPRYADFFVNLRKIGYKGRISLEANTTDFEADARAGLMFLKKMYAKYR